MENIDTINKTDIKEIVFNFKKSNLFHGFNNKKILLIGSAGFLGKYFVRVFDYILKNTKNKFYVDCLDNFISSSPTYGNLSSQISFSRKNIIYYKSKKKYDFIIFLAGIASPVIYKKYPLETLQVSYEGVKNLLEKSIKDKSKFFFLVLAKYMEILTPKTYPQKKRTTDTSIHLDLDHVTMKEKE